MSTFGIIDGDGAGNIQINLRQHQRFILDNMARFTVLICHRRFGKTALAVALSILKALQCPLPRPQVLYVATTYSAAKKIAWPLLRDMAAQLPGTVFNESELKATLITGAVIILGSADNPDASRGLYLDHLTIDEAADVPPSMWSMVLRPALSDRGGSALILGTPKGRVGLLHDLWVLAEDLPDWARFMFKASDTGIIDWEELVSAEATMSKAEYEQEYEVSWDAAVRGAYYGEAMSIADAEGRIGAWPHDPLKKTHIAMDLGIADHTACWFFQIDGGMVNLIEHCEYENSGLPDIVRDWEKRPYRYGKIICPHDINVRELGTGKSRLEVMRELGCDVIVAPKLEVIDGIEASRQLIGRCRFDRKGCSNGIEFLRIYHSDYDEKGGVLRLRPVHDLSSHASDAFRYLATTNLDQVQGEWHSTLDYSRMDKAICA